MACERPGPRWPRRVPDITRRPWPLVRRCPGPSRHHEAVQHRGVRTTRWVERSSWQGGTADDAVGPTGWADLEPARRAAISRRHASSPPPEPTSPGPVSSQGPHTSPRRRPRAEHLRLASYPRMGKRPRDHPLTPRPFASPDPCTENKSASSLRGVTRARGDRARFHRPRTAKRGAREGLPRLTLGSPL
jgi:hypothetical protein